MQRNRIAHYAGGGSDKIYITCIRQQPNGEFAVLGKWGRRGGTIKSQIKSTHGHIGAAQNAMQAFMNEKLGEGYRNIESPNYNGVVTIASVQQHLEAEPGVSSNPIEFDQPAVTKEQQERIDKINAGLLASRSGKIPLPVMRVKCINNLGIEDRFEQDAEYEAAPAKDRQMLTVTDMHGNKDEYFAERFVKAV
jgi:predicted DNA-binding WGR domain protein